MNKLFLGLLLLGCFYGYSQIPSGYYDDAQGLTGEELRSALHNIIDDHIEQSYSSLWIHFYSTDAKPGEIVWDMYSDIPGGTPAYVFNLGDDQCGNYGQEGDCYNREHSFPKSWFNDLPPMRTDLFHIYATDGYVNQKRSNYPYGEVGSVSWTSTNGSKVGNCSYAGYSGTVFEPLDEYKGDFARTYFYMMTRYLDKITAWNSPMLQSNNLSQWAENLLIEWSNEDPVSQKEINRNNAVYEIQENRNPFIDHPEWIAYVWGPSASIGDGLSNNVNMICFDDILTIKRETSQKGYLTIYNTAGQIISKYEINEAIKQISIEMNKGFYIAVFQSVNEYRALKIIK